MSLEASLKATAFWSHQFQEHMILWRLFVSATENVVEQLAKESRQIARSLQPMQSLEPFSDLEREWATLAKVSGASSQVEFPEKQERAMIAKAQHLLADTIVAQNNSLALVHQQLGNIPQLSEYPLVRLAHDLLVHMVEETNYYENELAAHQGIALPGQLRIKSSFWDNHDSEVSMANGALSRVLPELQAMQDSGAEGFDKIVSKLATGLGRKGSRHSITDVLPEAVHEHERREDAYAYNQLDILEA